MVEAVTITGILLLSTLILVVGQEVQAPIGDIHGRIKQYEGVDVYQFLGIPYAESPIGNLMLEKPQPINNLVGDEERTIYYATRYKESCPQRIPWYGTGNLPNHDQSFDCLLLNVYVPRNISAENRKSVMIYIHGGSYFYEQGMKYDGSLLSVIGDVIVVTINYRLDSYGFLSTKDKEIPGNLGLWDQRQAMMWVKQNIQAFGGDASSITIFGESAGSYSIGAHLLSPHNKGLFQRAICESGVTLSPIGLAYDPLAFSTKVSDAINCTQSKVNGNWNTTHFKICFKSKNVSEILQASVVASDFGVLAYRRIIGPIVNGDFLTDQPEKSMERNDVPFQNIDLLVGTNSGEGGQAMTSLKSSQKQFNFDITKGIPRNVFMGHFVPSIVRDYFKNSDDILNKIIDFYSEDQISDIDQARNVVDLFGDFVQHAPAVRTLQYHAKFAPKKRTYQYYFTHIPESQRSYHWFRGANHAAELAFVFGPELMYPPGTEISDAEIKLSRDIMKYWSNFAKYGNPGNNWQEYTEDNRHYMELDNKQVGHQDLLAERMKFWLYDLKQQSTSTAGTLYAVYLPIACFYILLYLMK